MKQIVVTLANKFGLHARPASKLVNLTKNFRGSVFIYKDGQKVNAKSILGIIMLEAVQGAEVVIEANGVDEEQLLMDIQALFNAKFNED